MSRTRAWRRFQEKKHKDRIRFMMKNIWRHRGWYQELDNPRLVGKLATTRQPCQNSCCNKRRFWEGPTHQELVAELEYEQEIAQCIK